MTVLTVSSVLWIAGCCSLLSVSLAVHLIRHHLTHFTKPAVQSKIIAILYMVPIYSVDSFLGLLWPNWALWINMMRDCYEAYVLYLFLSLMLSYLGCEEDDREIVSYLEAKLGEGVIPTGQLSKGKEFLRRCKFGTLQYCVIRPSTALCAILLDLLGAYDENDLSMHSSNAYLLFVINVSVAYAFYVLADFYYALKDRLQPYEPVGKFLCIKFVIFFAFWQSVAVTILVKLGIIGSMGPYGPETVATGLQDLLITIEMVFVSIAHLYAFSYEPFVEGYAPLAPSSPYKQPRRPLDVKRDLQLSHVEAGYSPPIPQPHVDSRAFSAHPPPRFSLPRAPENLTLGMDGSLLDKHFATKTAIRDFNEAMPVMVLPSAFVAKKGVVVRSDPAQRLLEAKAKK